MPQDGSSNYYYPPGTPGITNQTIESEAYNTFLDDLVINDLNWPRPVHRGGTGATTANQALINLSAEKANQQVTNYDSHIFYPGSFWSDSAANGAPVSSHHFVGIAYHLGGALTDLMIEARDMSDTYPGKVYVRRKSSDVWGAWTEETITGVTGKVSKTGDTMSGPLQLDYLNPELLFVKGSTASSTDIRAKTGASDRWIMRLSTSDPEGGVADGSNFAIYRYNNSGVAITPSPFTISRATGLITLAGAPTAADHAATKAYVDSGDSTAGVAIESKVNRGGDTMTGTLTLNTDPTSPLQAATKAYVDSSITTAGVAIDAKVWRSGDTMTGTLMLNADPISPLQAATKQYVDGQGALRVQVFTASGTYTPHADMIFCTIECLGGGGGGGSVLGAAGYSQGSAGGGSGGYSRLITSRTTVGASQAVTVGAGGNGGTAGMASNGGNGGDTYVGSLCTGKGGGGGQYAGTAQIALGGAGGVAGTGSLAAVGGLGGNGCHFATAAYVIYCPTGSGANSRFGAGGGAQNNTNGSSATGYGSGGGGTFATGALNYGGGAGAPGVVVITEFCKR